MSAWRLSVLGGTKLGDGSSAHALERKTAALLAYLALEGATSRSKLAGLLWPETSEKTARNNLSQLLRRLRGLTGEVLVTGGDLLTTSPELEVDAAAIKVAMFAGDYQGVIALSGELLPNDYDDLSDFADWLYAERESLTGLRSRALHAELNQLEEAGAYPDALALSERLLALDPVAEEAHRRAMRLHYLAGDRAGALRAFKRCQATLARELGVEPLPETARLAAEITRGQATVTPEAKPPSPQIPLRVLRPPVLVGREREWARMEAAWQAGQTIVVSGPPGSGKTRLMMDFAHGKGSYLLNEGRPGDEAVPLLSLARGFRRFFSTFAELSLEPWLALELARLLPDLFDLSPPPITSPEDQLRFHEAMYRAERLIMANVASVIADDLQFYDPASFDAASRATLRVVAEGITAQEARTLACFRTGEMPEPYLRHLEGTVAQGLAVHIELEPLAPGAVRELVKSLELDPLDAAQTEALGKSLHRYTGGNPLFIVETVKNLLESGRLGGELPQKLPPSGKVGALLAQRLHRLSAPALNLAWAAAVARDDFSLELASAALEEDAFALAAPCEELARAQIFSGGWFSHDLLFEASLAAIPAPVKTLLHRRCARYLEAQGANPARVAQHFLDAGEAARASPLLLKAAEAAQATYQFAEAANFLERVADIYQAQGDREQAFSALLELARLLIDADLGARMERTLERLEALATTPLARARALYLRAMHHGKLGQSEEAERAARRGLALIGEDGEPQLRRDLLNELGTALFLRSRLHEALAVFERTLELSNHPNKPQDLAATLSNIGVVLDHLEKHREAAAHHRRAADLVHDPKHGALRVSALNNLSISQVEQGLVHASLETLSTSLELCERLQGAEGVRFFSLSLLGACQADLARYCEALDTLMTARSLAEHYASYAVGAMERHLARIYLELGQPARAGELLDAAAARDELPGSHRVGIWLTRAELLAQTGGDPSAALETAHQYLQTADRTTLRVRYLLTEALLLAPELGLARAQEARTRLEASELGGLRIVAETRCAQLSLALGDARAALAHLAEVAALQTRYQPSEFYLGELYLTRYRTLAALGDASAQAALEACLAWIMNIANHHCPLEHRESFLTRNPINRAILEAAVRTGLELST